MISFSVKDYLKLVETVHCLTFARDVSLINIQFVGLVICIDVSSRIVYAFYTSYCFDCTFLSLLMVMQETIELCSCYLFLFLIILDFVQKYTKEMGAECC